MRWILWCGILLLISFTSSQAQTPQDTKGFLPKEFKKIYFGMSLNEFRKVKKVSSKELDDPMVFVTEYVEQRKRGKYTEVTYYFDVGGKAPFYEIVLDYRDEKVMQDEINSLLGKPNDGVRWHFRRSESFDIKAWRYETKLIIIAVLPEAAWSN